MPTFTQQELEEIRSNTERIERERLKKEAGLHGSEDGSDEDDESNVGGDGETKSKSRKKNGSKSDGDTKRKTRSKSKSKVKGSTPLVERLIGFILLLITIGVSYLIMVLN